jgi:UDP-N-acetyl-alpha-D-quinovosamine dehydrogenase
VRILVTGASGFIGSALCGELCARGHAVRAAVRSAADEEPERLERVVVSDIAGEFDRGALLDGIETVVHLVAVGSAVDEAMLRRINVEAAVRLARAAAGRVRRFVFLSSVKAQGEESGGRAFAETDLPRPEDAYGRAKLEAEHSLLEIATGSAMELAMLRPPLVYGPGVKGNFLRLLRWVDSGWPLPLGAVENRRSLIYLGNLVDAIAHCVEHPQASGTFLVADDESPSTPELIARIANALGRSARMWPVPVSWLRLAARIARREEEVRRLVGSLAVDTSLARTRFGWRPPFTLSQGLTATALWYRSLPC